MQTKSYVGKELFSAIQKLNIAPTQNIMAYLLAALSDENGKVTINDMYGNNFP